jgi:hypothetical protein
MNQELMKAIARSYESGMPFEEACGQSAYPLRISLKRPFPVSQIAKHMDEFIRWKHEIEDDCSRRSLPIEYREHGSRAFGRQRIPDAVIIADGNAHADILGRSDEYAAVQSLLEIVHGEAPELIRWGVSNYVVLLDIAVDLEPLLRVYRWRRNNPDASPFQRELQLKAVHTKLIEQHQNVLAAWFKVGLDADWLDRRKHFRDFERRYGFAREEHRFRFRFLASDNSPVPGVSDFSIYLHEMNESILDNIHSIVIVENHLTFLCLQPRTGVLAIDGMGYAAAELVNCNWLKKRRLLYFGDCDAHGLDILSRLRSIHPEVTSVCMNSPTFERFHRFATIDNTSPIPLPGSLLPEEAQLFEYLHERSLKGNTNRLEQERIPVEYVMMEIDAHLS